ATRRYPLWAVFFCRTAPNRPCILPSPRRFKSEDKSFSRGWIPRTTLRRRLAIRAAPPIARTRGQARAFSSRQRSLALGERRRLLDPAALIEDAAGHPAADQALATPRPTALRSCRRARGRPAPSPRRPPRG